jgi:undecaprenyl-diphosphatase
MFYSYLDSFDRSMALLANGFARRDPAFDHLVLDLAASALVNGGVFIAYFWWLWFKADDRAPSRRHDIVVTLFGAAVAVLIARVLQIALPFHPRPLHTAGLDFIPPAGVDPASLNHWSSMPSDHAVLFFALAWGVWRQSRLVGAIAMVWTAVLVCLPRLYLGYHYPSDLIAGGAIGIGLMAATHRLLRNTAWPARVARWETVHRTAFYALAFIATFELTDLFGDVRSLGMDGLRIVRDAAGLPASHAGAAETIFASPNSEHARDTPIYWTDPGDP